MVIQHFSKQNLADLILKDFSSTFQACENPCYILLQFYSQFTSFYRTGTWDNSLNATVLSCLAKVNVLKFQTLVACQKGLDKQCRPRSDCFLIRVFPACYSDKHFINSSVLSPENQQKEEKVRNLRIFTITAFLPCNIIIKQFLLHFLL